MKNKIINLYKNNSQIINYVIAGAFTTLVSLGSYYFCVLTFLDPNIVWQLQLANIISWILAVSFAYFCNRKYVFKSKNKRFKEIVKFFLARISTLIIDMLCMFIFTKVFLINDKIAKLGDQFIILVLNYLISKIFVFKKKDIDFN